MLELLLEPVPSMRWNKLENFIRSGHEKCMSFPLPKILHLSDPNFIMICRRVFDHPRIPLLPPELSDTFRNWENLSSLLLKPLLSSRFRFIFALCVWHLIQGLYRTTVGINHNRLSIRPNDWFSVRSKHRSNSLWCGVRKNLVVSS